MTYDYDKKLLKKLKDNYFTARALYETIKELAEEIDAKVLAENEFYETEESAIIMGHEKPERILISDHTYMMDLKKELPRYLDLVYPEYVKAGIADPRGRDYIPYAEEKDLYFKAKRQLVEYAIEIIPDTYPEKSVLKKWSLNLKYEEKILDIILKLEC